MSTSQEVDPTETVTEFNGVELRIREIRVVESLREHKQNTPNRQFAVISTELMHHAGIDHSMKFSRSRDRLEAAGLVDVFDEDPDQGESKIPAKLLRPRPAVWEHEDVLSLDRDKRPKAKRLDLVENDVEELRERVEFVQQEIQYLARQVGDTDAADASGTGDEQLDAIVADEWEFDRA